MKMLFLMLVLTGVLCGQRETGGVERAQRQMIELSKIYTLDTLVGDLRRVGFKVIYVKTSEVDAVFDMTPIKRIELLGLTNVGAVEDAISPIATVRGYDLPRKEIMIVTKKAANLMDGVFGGKPAFDLSISNEGIDRSLEILSSKIGYPVAHFSPVRSSIKEAKIRYTGKQESLLPALSVMMGQLNIRGGWTLAMSLEADGSTPFALLYTY